ncbi:hypothetical protein NDU88_001839 [Pleurodeles waltl]|uniref:Uncharacterized protein n=1 Tax=Pleurodeles waltl TaxID=8319 RepID=A0AAV7UTW5_PLEWA|nr:hypothetical protein NDU88_001839 [Pleurodeles waltl]
MSPGQPGKFAQACFVGRASGDKERWKHGAAQGGEAAVQRVVRGSENKPKQADLPPNVIGRCVNNCAAYLKENAPHHRLTPATQPFKDDNVL